MDGRPDKGPVIGMVKLRKVSSIPGEPFFFGIGRKLINVMAHMFQPKRVMV
ncbi:MULTISPECIES: hypothetical protein [Chryseobacterium]|uniref:hypothetical protein n=1 Tax=Chryseobacterium TaxID=59732 RepID=UPI00145754AE|nr:MULTISPECIES: hypothetical protein [Chryseobacterium]